jgi:hypothetical protein
MDLAILSVSFLAFLLLGVPVSFALGLSCVLTYLHEGLPAATAMQSMISGMNAFSFLAVPFFILSGELMLHGGIADRILRFAQSLVGHFRGGLGMANVVACTLFGGVSGSPTADTSAMGGVVIPLMKREGYSAAYAVNVTTHASLAGALMPTSTNMIIYAFAAQGIVGSLNGQPVSGVSIGDLLFSGLLPVLWVMGFVLIAAYWQAKRYGFPRRADGSTELPPFPGWFAVARAFVGAVPGLMVIALILVCVAMGIATATEAAAPAAAGGLGDLGRGVAQRGADLVDLHLDDGALLALLGLVRARDQPAGDDDPRAAGEGLGDVLRRVAPDRAAHEQRLAVLPLVRLAVERAGGRGDREVGHRRPGRREPQFGVVGQVADDRDDGFAGHRFSVSSPDRGAARRFVAGLSGRRAGSASYAAPTR